MVLRKRGVTFQCSPTHSAIPVGVSSRAFGFFVLCRSLNCVHTNLRLLGLVTAPSILPPVQSLLLQQSTPGQQVHWFFHRQLWLLLPLREQQHRGDDSPRLQARVNTRIPCDWPPQSHNCSEVEYHRGDKSHTSQDNNA